MKFKVPHFDNIAVDSNKYLYISTSISNVIWKFYFENTNNE